MTALSYLHQFVFGIYPYIALAVFFVGSLVRFDRDQYTWKSDSSQLLRRRELRWGSNLFHFGILVVFFGHLFGFLVPEPWVDVFGQTECMPTTLTPLSSAQRDPNGCGIAAPDLEVALLDDEDNVLEGEAKGEICLRPKQPYAMFDGYFDNPAATLAACRGLWYHTGDYGQRLRSGAFAFVDRKKDCMRRRGENIASVELEHAIDAHPAVVESAVHAVASTLGEDDIKVCIVASASIEPAELFAFFKTNLPYFAIPRYVEFLAALPRNGVGRVMKHKLREAGNPPGTWDFEALGLTVTKQERR